MRRRLAVLLAAAVALALALPAVALPAGAEAQPGPGPGGGDRARRETLQRYAADTWRSFAAMVDPGTGLPADNLQADGTRSAYTSPTNIGAYLWSTIAARDLRIISRREADRRITQTVATVAGLERHAESGQFYNWYDPATGAKLTVWPVDGGTVNPFLSSVDNGWLAAALMMVERAVPRAGRRAGTLADSMDFGFYYDPDVGQIRGGYWPDPPSGCHADGFTCHHYGALNPEPRIASYIGIARGQIPPEHYFRMFRTFPATCDWSWQETRPVGETRTYLGVDVFEGAYPYRGMQIVPSWGGSMFEALMPNLLVPEAAWGPSSWGVNHPLYVRAQLEHGLEEAGYGYWGFSPSTNPAGGYREYGVDAIGLNPDGYSPNNANARVDDGFEGCREPGPASEDYRDGVVTPHAAFLALEFAPAEAMANLAALAADFDGVYSDHGFADAVNVSTGEVSQQWLALDQGMVMAALANELDRGGRFRRYFTRGEVERAVRPLLAQEVFSAGQEP